jgi:hypothetical protein
MSPLFTIISGNFFVAANDPFIFLFLFGLFLLVATQKSPLFMPYQRQLYNVAAVYHHQRQLFCCR